MGSSQSSPIEVTTGSVIDLRHGSTTLDSLVQAIAPLRGVRSVTLLLGNMALNEPYFHNFCQILTKNPALLHHLSIRTSRIPASAFRTFSTSISALVSLELDNVGLNEAAMNTIGRQLASARRLTKLALNNDAMGLHRANLLTFIEGVVASNVKELQLCDNGIHDLEAAEMCRLLSSSKLEHLSLDGNKIGVWGARAISDYLSLSGCRVHTLTLSRNSICADGAAALASMIVQNMNLKELDLTANPITESGVDRIASSLEVNLSLVVVKLPLAESLSPNEMSRLRQVLQRNRNFQESSLPNIDESSPAIVCEVSGSAAAG